MVIMSSGRKRIHDTSIEDEDDFCPSSKFARVRSRTRAPTRIGKSVARNNGSLDSNSFGSVSVAGSHTSNYSDVVPGSSRGGNRTFNNGHTLDKMFGFGKMKPNAKPVPFHKYGNAKDSSGKNKLNNQSLQTPGKARQSNSFKRFKRSSEDLTRNNKKKFVPHGTQTPEYMKIKEDESLIEVKKERKRKRNKIMSLRTAKGQPVMRGRIELMLEEIKASTSSNQ